MLIGSLFSGIGGLELGLELALGGRVVWQVEREPWPRAVLARHWPDADRSVTDVCKAGAANLAPVDLVCGGFPCQDVSPIGTGKGVEHGERSGTWAEFARIVRELRPRFVVVENSAALPSRGLNVVLGELAAGGYDAEWRRLGACDVGAPHRRYRTFVVAYRPQQYAVISRLAAESIARDERAIRAHVANTSGQRQQRVHRARLSTSTASRGGSADRTRDRADAVPEPSVRRVVNGLPCWVGNGPQPRHVTGPQIDADGRAALRALGNAVVPAVAYEVGLWLRAIIERERLH